MRLDEIRKSTSGKYQQSDSSGKDISQINELSKKTLSSYMKAASTDMNNDRSDAESARWLSADGKNHGDSDKEARWEDEAKWLDNRAKKRSGNIHKAASRLTELSTDKLADYKTAASKAATAADAKGDFATGNKRFSGIIKATKKQFDNDSKKTK